MFPRKSRRAITLWWNTYLPIRRLESKHGAFKGFPWLTGDFPLGLSRLFLHGVLHFETAFVSWCLPNFLVSRISWLSRVFHGRVLDCWWRAWRADLGARGTRGCLNFFLFLSLEGDFQRLIRSSFTAPRRVAVFLLVFTSLLFLTPICGTCNVYNRTQLRSFLFQLISFLNWLVKFFKVLRNLKISNESFYLRFLRPDSCLSFICAFLLLFPTIPFKQFHVEESDYPKPKIKLLDVQR